MLSYSSGRRRPKIKSVVVKMISAIILTVLVVGTEIALAAKVQVNQLSRVQGEKKSALWLRDDAGSAARRAKRATDSHQPDNMAETLQSIEFLKHYGYLKSNKDGNGSVSNLVSSDEFRDSLKEFQRFAHIAQTGLLDKETSKYMEKPRCAMQDIPDSPETGLRRTKRYVLAASKWSESARGRLTYRIETYPSHFKASRRAVDELLKRAFKFWSQAAYVDFNPKGSGSVTFVIKFLSRNHGDGYNFDGPGRTLAHAFYPRFGGAIHFDDDENWTIDRADGTDMLWVAVHEIGHALGLLHSDREDAVMWPYYTGYDPNFGLRSDDVAGVQAHYGTRGIVVVKSPDDPAETTTESTIRAPDLCKISKLDAYMSRADIKYIFRGEYYWKPPANNQLGEPRRIEDGWPQAPNDLDTALAHDDIYLFKGNQYWTYNYKRQLTHGARPMSEWSGIPDDLDAAFVWPKNNKTYFFKGDQYWRYDWDSFSVDKMYPLSMKEWKGVDFNRLDAVIPNGEGLTYFVEDDRLLVYSDSEEKVIGRPRPIRDELEILASCRVRA